MDTSHSWLFGDARTLSLLLALTAGPLVAVAGVCLSATKPGGHSSGLRAGSYRSPCSRCSSPPGGWRPSPSAPASSGPHSTKESRPDPAQLGRSGARRDQRSGAALRSAASGRRSLEAVERLAEHRSMTGSSRRASGRPRRAAVPGRSATLLVPRVHRRCPLAPFPEGRSCRAAQWGPLGRPSTCCRAGRQCRMESTGNLEIQTARGMMPSYCSVPAVPPPGPVSWWSTTSPG
jgi:hypothetical protein